MSNEDESELVSYIDEADSYKFILDNIPWMA